MSLSRDDVEKIAHLARLGIQESDIPSYTENLSDIFDMVAQMNKIDTSKVLPMAHPLDTVQRLREDKVKEIDGRDSFQELAPDVEAGLYLVPKVIE